MMMRRMVMIIMVVIMMMMMIIIIIIISHWSRVLPEKLTGLQILKKSCAFYSTRKFATAFTKARHLSLP
jgi:hypothetical protein